MIEHISINRFWERYSIDWTPNPDVNILIGINGSGKSTLLKIVHTALSGINMISNVDALLPVGYTVKIKGNGIDIVTPTSGGESICVISCRHGFVNTFDEIIVEKKALEQAQSPLTASLYTALFDTRKASLNSYRLKATEDKDTAVLIHDRLQQWTSIVNTFFAATHKTIEIKGNDIFFKQYDEQRINLEQLSSGEKQMLLILTNVLLQDKEPYILLMDEPEISLDIDWQDKLISTIRALNPNCQLFIATHAPSIFGDGWNNKLFFMEDLLKAM